MDLREFRTTPEQIEAAAQHLRYQPFVIDDERHTGVAYSWLQTSDPTTASSEDFLFDRRSIAPEVWNKAYDDNRRLAAMYDDFIERIVNICPPDGAYLDLGCNTGYFPVSVSRAGIQTAVGVDLGDYSNAFRVLNEITGASARFSTGGYNPCTRTINLNGNLPGVERYDVVSASAVLCHLSDPLYVLKAMAQLASKAIFIWNSFLETDELLIRYNLPNKFSNAEFPQGFDDGTSISLGLLFLSMEKLGFPHHEELQIQPDWMPEGWIRPVGVHAFLFWR
jgi:SAM-dependent methyltransferase